MLQRKTDTIPKIDQVAYLFEALGCIKDQFSFEEIRQELITVRPEWAEPRKTPTPTTFWSNARDVLRELMRLGLVSRAPLPSRTDQLDGHRNRHFSLTDEGKQFLTIEEQDVWDFRYRFAEAMLLAHPYLQELHRRLTSQELFFPRIQRSDLPGEAKVWKTSPPEPLIQVASYISNSLRATLHLNVTADAIEQRMRPYLTSAWKRLKRDQKDHIYSKAVVKTINDVAVRVLLHFAGMRLDFVTFRSAVALLSDLNAIWDTRSLADRRGWTIWATSLVPLPTLTGRSPAAEALARPVWFRPTKVADEHVVRCLTDTFLSSSNRRGGFALIHEIRAQVCYKLKIHGRDFDSVLRRLHAQEISDAQYAINLDRGGGEELPPSAEAFRIDGRGFYLMTLLRR